MIFDVLPFSSLLYQRRKQKNWNHHSLSLLFSSMIRSFFAVKSSSCSSKASMIDEDSSFRAQSFLLSGRFVCQILHGGVQFRTAMRQLSFSDVNWYSPKKGNGWSDHSSSVSYFFVRHTQHWCVRFKTILKFFVCLYPSLMDCYRAVLVDGP